MEKFIRLSLTTKVASAGGAAALIIGISVFAYKFFKSEDSPGVSGNSSLGGGTQTTLPVVVTETTLPDCSALLSHFMELLAKGDENDAELKKVALQGLEHCKTQFETHVSNSNGKLTFTSVPKIAVDQSKEIHNNRNNQEGEVVEDAKREASKINPKPKKSETPIPFKVDAVAPQAPPPTTNVISVATSPKVVKAVSTPSPITSQTNIEKCVATKTSPELGVFEELRNNVKNFSNLKAFAEICKTGNSEEIYLKFYEISEVFFGMDNAKDRQRLIDIYESCVFPTALENAKEFPKLGVSLKKGLLDFKFEFLNKEFSAEIVKLQSLKVDTSRTSIRSNRHHMVKSAIEVLGRSEALKALSRIFKLWEEGQDNVLCEADIDESSDYVTSLKTFEVESDIICDLFNQPPEFFLDPLVRKSFKVDTFDWFKKDNAMCFLKSFMRTDETGKVLQKMIDGLLTLRGNYYTESLQPLFHSVRSPIIREELEKFIEKPSVETALAVVPKAITLTGPEQAAFEKFLSVNPHSFFYTGYFNANQHPFLSGEYFYRKALSLIDASDQKAELPNLTGSRNLQFDDFVPYLKNCKGNYERCEHVIGYLEMLSRGIRSIHASGYGQPGMKHSPPCKSIADVLDVVLFYYYASKDFDENVPGSLASHLVRNASESAMKDVLPRLRQLLQDLLEDKITKDVGGLLILVFNTLLQSRKTMHLDENNHSSIAYALKEKFEQLKIENKLENKQDIFKGRHFDEAFAAFELDLKYEVIRYYVDPSSNVQFFSNYGKLKSPQNLKSLMDDSKKCIRRAEVVLKPLREAILTVLEGRDSFTPGVHFLPEDILRKLPEEAREEWIIKYLPELYWEVSQSDRDPLEFKKAVLNRLKMLCAGTLNPSIESSKTAVANYRHALLVSFLLSKDNGRPFSI